MFDIELEKQYRKLLGSYIYKRKVFKIVCIKAIHL
jgi:hypothetical protein